MTVAFTEKSLLKSETNCSLMIQSGVLVLQHIGSYILSLKIILWALRIF